MVETNITNGFERIELNLERVRQLTESVCERFGANKAVVGIVIVDDETFRQLNHEFLGRDGTSDCLSFDLSDDEQKCFEVVVNADVAIAQADSRGHGVEAEVALYIVHGLLHQLGFDDGEDDAAARMHAMEDEILNERGYGNVYADRPGDEDVY